MSKTRLLLIAGVAVGALTACGPDNAGGSVPTTTMGSTTETGAAASGSEVNAQLQCTPGSGRKFDGSAPMNLTDLGGAQLDCAVFDHQTMNDVKLREAHLSGARFQNSTINRVDFRDALLRGAVFADDTLNVAAFRGADLTGADLRAAKLTTVDFAGATCPDGTKSGDARGCTSHLTPSAGKPPATATTTEAPKTSSGGSGGGGGDPAAPSVFNQAANGTYRCTGGQVLVNGANSDLHLTGSCGTVLVNGANSDVEIDDAQRILVNGAKASVVYHGSPHVSVSGYGATAHRG